MMKLDSPRWLTELIGLVDKECVDDTNFQELESGIIRLEVRDGVLYRVLVEKSYDRRKIPSKCLDTSH